MGGTMRKKYIGIAIPESLIKQMDEFVKKDEWGYKSRAELAKDAIRQLLVHLNWKKR